MRKFILDTDIGADCDDVAALYYLLGKMKRGECEVSGITLCTARRYAAAAVKAFLCDCGCDIPIGMYNGRPLDCDKNDNYAERIAKKDFFECENAVSLMRKTLAMNDKTDIICIGPACNVAALLNSGADEFSDKTGEELVMEKGGTLYLMGGAFDFCGEKPFVEWNIEQDIESAQIVFEKYPNEILICPSEVGSRVATILGCTYSLLREAMSVFFKSVDERCGIKYIENPERTRPSWDPITCMAALYEDMFSFSENGKVSVANDGMTSFEILPCGKHKYMVLNNDFAKTEKSLNDYLNSL